jgi:hypothetical protein
MLLYDSQVSGNCYKVRLLLAHLGIAYERQEVSVFDRSNRREMAVRAIRSRAAWPRSRATSPSPTDRHPLRPTTARVLQLTSTADARRPYL